MDKFGSGIYAYDLPVLLQYFIMSPSMRKPSVGYEG